MPALSRDFAPVLRNIGCMEDSARIYIGIYDPIGTMECHFMCLDLNTLKLVCVQDCLTTQWLTRLCPNRRWQKHYLYARSDLSSLAGGQFHGSSHPGKLTQKQEIFCGKRNTTAVPGSDLLPAVFSLRSRWKKIIWSDNLLMSIVSRTGGLANGVLACLDKKPER